MMSKTARKSRIALAFAGVTAGLVTLFGFSAEAASPAPAPVAATTPKAAPSKPVHDHRTDCKYVARMDRKLCAQVQKQHSYGAYYGDQHAYWSVPNGRVIVHELTHQGYTAAEMRAALRGSAKEYRDYVTAVPVNMDSMVNKCGNTDGQWVVSYRDEDGKPGGTKLTYARIVCA